MELGLPIKEFFIWTDDWEYTRRISRKYPCYAVADSTVVHLSKSNIGANIADESAVRLSRFDFLYRNDVFLYRREGLCGWLWLLAKDGWHSAQVIRRGKLPRLRVIWRGFREGLRFAPAVEDDGGADNRGSPS